MWEFVKRQSHPCPCGHYGDPLKECRCSFQQIQRYRSRLSGPLLDRIDIHIEVPAVKYKELTEEEQGEGSPLIRQRVQRARRIQQERFRGEGIYCNAQMRTSHLKRYCILKEDSQRLLEVAMKRLGLSARAYTRILKVARTIADLEAEEDILPHHISEAIQYRSLDRSSF